ncbi:MAG: cysteine hydrolase [Bacilli bacterium]|nr:cysteine hydrolase [Bacilli bacterium]
MKNVKNLKMYKKVLIVVDMVNGFVREGALADKHIEGTIANQVALIKQYKEEGNLVIFIKDTHTENSVEHDRFGGALHCIKGTKEAELIDELKPYENTENTISIEKNSTSYIWAENEDGTKFLDVLEGLENVGEVEVVGCCTDICITNGVLPMMNYFDQKNRRVNVTLYEDAIDTYGIPGIHDRKQYEDAAYLLLKQQGAKVKKIGTK